MAAPYSKLVGYFDDNAPPSEYQNLTDGSVPKDKYAYLVVNFYVGGDSGAVAAIKAYHPHAKLFAYQNFGGMNNGTVTNGRPQSLITYNDATTHDTNDPSDSWFCHTLNSGSEGPANSKIYFTDFTQLYASNISRASWQSTASQHFSQITSDGFDGVFLDDVNMVPFHGWGAATGNASVEFATDTAYGAAVAAALPVVGASAQSTGLLVVPNVGVNPWTSSQYANYTSMLGGGGFDGYSREFWVNFSGMSGPGGPAAYFTTTGGGANDGQWTPTMQMFIDAQASGKFGFLNTYPLSPSQDDFDSIQYSLASFYTYWDGVTVSGSGYNYGLPLSSYPFYGADIGVPSGPACAVGTGYQRRYSNGMVLINPASAGSVSFTLGASYADPSGVLRTSVTLGPATGQVLSFSAGQAGGAVHTANSGAWHSY